MRDDKSKIGDCKGISNIKLGSKRQGAAMLAIYISFLGIMNKSQPIRNVSLFLGLVLGNE